MQSKSLKLVEYTSQMVKPTENDTVYYASKDSVVGYFKVPVLFIKYTDGTVERVYNVDTFDENTIPDEKKIRWWH